MYAKNSSFCKMGPLQKLEGMLPATAFAQLKFKVNSKGFGKLSAEVEHSSFYTKF